MHKLPWLRHLPYGIVLLLIVAFGVWRSQVENQEQAKQQARHEQEKQQARMDFQGMTMGQTIAHCRALMSGYAQHQLPLALAWSPGRLEWYVPSGVDNTSMRHQSCTSEGIRGGWRYPRAAISPALNAVDVNLFTYYASFADEGTVALEAAIDPATQTRLERRWSHAGAGTASPPAVALPLLLHQPAPHLAVKNVPANPPLAGATDWLKQPTQVLDVLARHLPPDARISEIDVREGSIKLTIVGPVKNFDNKPPASFGDASFDEYGIRDADWWYPRDSGSCSPGYSLSQVSALLAQATNLNDPRVWNAWFGCNRGKGDWVLRVPKRRR